MRNSGASTRNVLRRFLLSVAREGAAAWLANRPNKSKS
jgi:hypothetical protein